MKTLPPIHTSPETAFIIEDYPLGFRLRCKKRVWIEYKKNKGFRFCSQTTDPRKSSEVWNAPKYSTYSEVAMVMYLDDAGHVQQTSLTFYQDAAECKEWRDTYKDGLSAYQIETLDKWIAHKEKIEANPPKYNFVIKENEPVRIA